MCLLTCTYGLVSEFDPVTAGKHRDAFSKEEVKAARGVTMDSSSSPNRQTSSDDEKHLTRLILSAGESWKTD